MRLGGVEKERVDVCSAPNANVATRGLGAGLLRCSFDEAPGRKLLGETHPWLLVAHPRPSAAAGCNVCRLDSFMSVFERAVPNCCAVAFAFGLAAASCPGVQRAAAATASAWGNPK